MHTYCPHRRQRLPTTLGTTTRPALRRESHRHCSFMSDTVHAVQRNLAAFYFIPAFAPGRGLSLWAGQPTGDSVEPESRVRGIRQAELAEAHGTRTCGRDARSRSSRRRSSFSARRTKDTRRSGTGRRRRERRTGMGSPERSSVRATMLAVRLGKSADATSRQGRTYKMWRQ